MNVEKLVIIDGAVVDLRVLRPARDLLLVVVDLRMEHHSRDRQCFTMLLSRKLKVKSIFKSSDSLQEELVFKELFLLNLYMSTAISEI
jgi:hypothetical protein